jgi:hypothetical protein
LTGSLQGAGPQTFGAPPSLAEVTPIAQVVARPADFEGKAVRLDGVVTAVCQMMGCWMALAPIDNPRGPAVRFKVEDGVIVFPVSAKGKRASAQGVVEFIAPADLHGREAAAEHAQHDGRATATAPALWHIKATGAVVY